jgi:hypothetical protein
MSGAPFELKKRPTRGVNSNGPTPADRPAVAPCYQGNNWFRFTAGVAQRASTSKVATPETSESPSVHIALGHSDRTWPTLGR